MREIVVHLLQDRGPGFNRAAPECGRFAPKNTPITTGDFSKVTCGLCKRTVRFKEHKEKK